MSIRKRLLWLLLPPLICFVTLISVFFYYNWHSEIVATANPELVATKLHNALLMIILSAIFTMFLVVISVLVIADKISKPMQKLKNAALDIAAGDYDENIQVEGPQEFVDLANTLNTMKECLEENMIRLKESSVARERLYGEYECAVLLQNQMFQKTIESFSSKHLTLHPIKVTTTTTPYGLQLKVSDHQVEFLEANEVGFHGIYELLTQQNEKKFPQVKIEFEKNFESLNYLTQGMPSPIVWDTEGQHLKTNHSQITLKKKDLIFLTNQGFSKHFESEEAIHNWFKKLLRHYATEGMELFLMMLTSQLNFLVKKHHVEQDIYILCVEVN